MIKQTNVAHESVEQLLIKQTIVTNENVKLLIKQAIVANESLELSIKQLTFNNESVELLIKQTIVANESVEQLLKPHTSGFVAFIGDNGDHSVATLNGKGTFHGMGIIAAIPNKG